MICEGLRAKTDPGLFKPVVDARRCEGKAACAAVCPYGVFEIGRLSDATFNDMPLFTKLKLWAHGRKTAYTPHADACRACALCVTACPERAIRLERVQESGQGEDVERVDIEKSHAR